MFAVLLLAERRRRFEGFIFLLALVLYSIERFFVDMTRFYDAESTLYLLGLSPSINQVISLVVFVIALVIIIFKYRRTAKSLEAQ